MANIAVRSPYFVSVSTSGGAYAILSVGGYNIRKDATGYVDISDIARDSVNPTYSGSISSSSTGSATITGSYTIYDSSGSVVSSNQGAFSHVAYDGYGYFSDGSNYTLSGTPLSGTEIWFPEDTAGSIYTALGTKTSFLATDTSVGGITIKRQMCSKYTPIKAAFINRFGVPQELYFFGAIREAVSSEGETYKVGAVGGTYTTTSHQRRTLVKNGSVSYTLSTGFVSEVYNEYVREMMVSEQVWLVIDGVTRPVHPVSSSVELRTSLNDKLVEYTVQFEQANDLISTMR